MKKNTPLWVKVVFGLAGMIAMKSCLDHKPEYTPEQKAKYACGYAVESRTKLKITEFTAVVGDGQNAWKVIGALKGTSRKVHCQVTKTGDRYVATKAEIK